MLISTVGLPSCRSRTGSINNIASSTSWTNAGSEGGSPRRDEYGAGDRDVLADVAARCYALTMDCITSLTSSPNAGSEGGSGRLDELRAVCTGVDPAGAAVGCFSLGCVSLVCLFGLGTLGETPSVGGGRGLRHGDCVHARSSLSSIRCRAGRNLAFSRCGYVTLAVVHFAFAAGPGRSLRGLVILLNLCEVEESGPWTFLTDAGSEGASARRDELRTCGRRERHPGRRGGRIFVLSMVCLTINDMMSFRVSALRIGS
jgi:hypothetical protein